MISFRTAPAFGIRLPSLSPLSLAGVRQKQLLGLFLLGDTRSFLARARDNGDNGPHRRWRGEEVGRAAFEVGSLAYQPPAVVSAVSGPLPRGGRIRLEVVACNSLR